MGMVFNKKTKQIEGDSRLILPFEDEHSGCSTLLLVAAGVIVGGIAYLYRNTPSVSDDITEMKVVYQINNKYSDFQGNTYNMNMYQDIPVQHGDTLNLNFVSRSGNKVADLSRDGNRYTPSPVFKIQNLTQSHKQR